VERIFIIGDYGHILLSKDYTSNPKLSCPHHPNHLDYVHLSVNKDVLGWSQRFSHEPTPDECIRTRSAFEPSTSIHIIPGNLLAFDFI